MTEDLHKRSIRSFVLRQGRVSEAQQRALAAGHPQFGIAFAPRLLDLDAAFGRGPGKSAPKILEIGFGMGETTAVIAQAHPQNDYLGIEVHTPGVGALFKQISETGLTNIRIIQHDAVEVLTHMLAPASLDGVHVFFPDPWPKKRHHKRRLLQPPLVALLASRLKPGGYLHAATDWEEYAQQILAVFTAEPLLENTAPAAASNAHATAGYAPRPASRPQTKFETRGLKLGHTVWDVLFRKR